MSLRYHIFMNIIGLFDEAIAELLIFPFPKYAGDRANDSLRHKCRTRKPEKRKQTIIVFVRDLGSHGTRLRSKQHDTNSVSRENNNNETERNKKKEKESIYLKTQRKSNTMQ
ncbi:hypothetical protein CEXT_340011 [Caerostris extrusa]|uniref:Uncharacterized protein n=1 Tax=Caerostris extrusa TaxID=172846 RepID=A0AAV4UDN3_CAEEX|nr:hypothetical protein CEXT_340011 [Caerostris extrusa]